MSFGVKLNIETEPDGPNVPLTPSAYYSAVLSPMPCIYLRLKFSVSGEGLFSLKALNSVCRSNTS